MSGISVLTGAAANIYLGYNNPLVYIAWSMASILLLYNGSIIRNALISLGIMYFTGMIDTFSLTLIQIIHIGTGVDATKLQWWMETAYILSFILYVAIYRLILKNSNVYLGEIKLKYKIALLIQLRIFQMFYNLVFGFFQINHERYSTDAYLIFITSIIGAYYAIFHTLQLAVSNTVSASQVVELEKYTIMQKQQYEYQLKTDIELRKLRHDLSNHLGVIRELIYDNKLDESKRYIDSLLEAKEVCNTKYYTGDSFLDVLVKYYAFLCETGEITFEIKGHLNEELMLEIIDMTTLIGNALQNALEAALEADVREIHLELADHRKEVFIIISNTCKDIVDVDKNFCQSSKTDKKRHGFGLKNINGVIEKYDGEYYINTLNDNGINWFNMTLIIPKGEK
ncbi:MAG: GHKL domain-containing protein [Pseudobutyrivibrio sp.]|nr:GHKL domain-containing protein [Pseudobutyrivibrio sp.]